MKIDTRWVVAAVILFFTWKGADLSMSWTPVKPPIQPSTELLPWADDLRPILPKMIVKDRLYLSSLYEAMAFVLVTDGDRAEPIISDTNKFVAFHAGTLNLGIRRENVGKYPGLGEAIDKTFVTAIGSADERKIDKAMRDRLVAACGVLSWAFSVGGDG